MLDLFHPRSELIVRRDHGVLDPNCHADTHRFHDGIGSLDLLRALRLSRQRRRPLSLYVQFPTASVSVPAYLQRLEREIDLLGCHLGPQQRVEQLHLGGATPDAE